MGYYRKAYFKGGLIMQFIRNVLLTILSLGVFGLITIVGLIAMIMN